jgi:hypothetical protein
MVAPEALTTPQSVATSAFAANELTLGPARHRPFADATPLPIKARMTAASAERLADIGDRRGQFGAAAGIAAVIPGFNFECGHESS